VARSSSPCLPAGAIGERRSLRKISAELAAAGYLNERGRPSNPNSIKLMLEG
jgi:hypothetical protein